VEVSGQYTIDVACGFVAPDSWRWLVHRVMGLGGEVGKRSCCTWYLQLQNKLGKNFIV